MTEMSNTCECHGDTMFVRSGSHFLVTDAAAGLNDCGCACFDDDVQSVPEREKRIRRYNRLCQCEIGLLCFDDAMRALSTRLICPAPIPMV